MYIVEGNIGVGKSTFLSLIQTHLKTLTCTPEPVDTWAHQAYGKSLLGEFYAAPHRWAYTIETLAMICRSRDHMTAQQQDVHHLMERSIYSGHYCFALNGHQAGYFTDLEWDLYNQWTNFLFTQKCRPPRGFIYLQAAPEVCYARIARRERNGENLIAQEYLQKLHQRHEAFLVNRSGISDAIAHVPVLILDANIDFVDSKQKMREHAEAVAAFIAQTSYPLAAPGQHSNHAHTIP